MKSSRPNPSPPIRKRSDVDREAAAHVYTLKVVRESDGVEYYYVGKVTARFQKLETRIRSHFAGSSNITGVTITNTGPALISKHRADQHDLEKDEFSATEVISFEPMYRFEDESWPRFKSRVKEQERRRSYEVAIKHETTKVIGGR